MIRPSDPNSQRRRAIPSKALLINLLTVTACTPTPDVTVRHFGSTENHQGTQIRLFIFGPREPRSLDDRIRLTRAEIARDPACRWADTPRDVIEAATLRQGAAYRDTLLAAPVICTA